jgi:hypothetical protein
VSGRIRYANQAHKIRVTDGHEAEAQRAESRRPLNGFQRFFLRTLGLRGDVAPQAPEHHPGPSHTRPVHHEQFWDNEDGQHSGPGGDEPKRAK